MKRLLLFVLILAIAASLGCGMGSSQYSQNNPGVFVTGEDAPLSSVVGFQLTLNSVTLNGQKGSAQVLTNTTVDFARLLGLRSPLAFSSVPADTYNSVTIVVSNPMISYVDMTLNPPALTNLPGTLPNSPDTVSVNLPTPMVVGSNGLAGLKMELDIRQSLAVDPNTGQITGSVNPVFYVKATKASDPDGHITDLMGGVVSVSANNDSFILQGPYGRQLTVDVNSSTQFNSGWSINNLAPPAFVAVQGRFQADGSLLADSIEVITTAQSFVSGRILQVGPDASGHLQVTMWVGETGADMVNDVDTVMTFDVSGVTEYDICFLENGLTQLLFNANSMIVGQRIFIGGSFAGGVFTPAMISLRRQGVFGTFDGGVNITNGNAGSFLLDNNGLVGYSAGGPVTVATFNNTIFFNLTGLAQLGATPIGTPIVVRGLFLKDPNTGNPTFYAGFVADPPQPAGH